MSKTTNTNLTADYWTQRYQDNNAPWDLGHVSRPLRRIVDNLTDKDLRILIPGGGSGHELVYLHDKGFKNAVLLDWSAEVIGRVRQKSPSLPESATIVEDFFTHEGQYDLILEQTFYCALSPDLRDDYVRQMYNLLVPGGVLTGVLFTFPLTEKGPPFGGSLSAYRERFGQYFEIQTLEACAFSEQDRAGKEAYFTLRKTVG